MTGAFRPAADTGVTVADDASVVYLARLPGGPLVVLEGPAARIWVEATTAPAEGWVARVAGAFDEPEEAVCADVDRFVVELQGQGFLEPVPAAGA
ncbi:PqqD family peptide modification chaperone [Terrabacter sp. NPDC080008]|uniref:PqqD family protein n=1 Tax=Terrabacter sp. NPDC080008 TaxID=3155176 RepID=UPI00344F1453